MDEEDPFCMFTPPPPANAAAGKGSSAIASTFRVAAQAIPWPTSWLSPKPPSASHTSTPSHARHVRQSSELLLPSLGSVNAMLAATSNPVTPCTAGPKPTQPGQPDRGMGSKVRSSSGLPTSQNQQQQVPQPQVSAWTGTLCFYSSGISCWASVVYMLCT